MTPGPGFQNTFYLPAGHWSASASFRYYNARQDVLGSRPQKDPLVYANTHVYASDLGISYAVTDSFDLSMEVPVQYGTRETAIEHNYLSSDLHTQRAFGFGDMRLRAEYWLFNPKDNAARNIALGIGVRAPTGQHDETDYAYRATGRITRPVDPAIQPATGGWGIILSMHAYSSLDFSKSPRFSFTHWLKDTYAYADAVYVVTPQEYNHTQSPFGDEPAITGGMKGFTYDSIPDQFLTRVGLSQLIWPSKGVSLSAGLRWEGVPAHDWIGGSDGWRLPGAALSFEPTLSIDHGQESFSISVPVALYRVAFQGVEFQRAKSTTPGLATIADVQLIVSYAHRF